MFKNCVSLVTLPDISNWNTNSLIDTSRMYHGCFSLISLPDLSKWNTHKVTDMNCMFSE